MLYLMRILRSFPVDIITPNLLVAIAPLKEAA